MKTTIAFFALFIPAIGFASPNCTIKFEDVVISTKVTSMDCTEVDATVGLVRFSVYAVGTKNMVPSDTTADLSRLADGTFSNTTTVKAACKTAFTAQTTKLAGIKTNEDSKNITDAAELSKLGFVLLSTDLK